MVFAGEPADGLADGRGGQGSASTGRRAPKQYKVSAILRTASSGSPLARATSSSECTPSKSMGTRISDRSVITWAVMSAALVELSRRKTLRPVPRRKAIRSVG